MALRFDPRGDLPPPTIQPTSYYSRPDTMFSHFEKRRTSTFGMSPTYPKRKPCHDWILSSASNVHVAIDRSSYKTYTSFKSYVLAVADDRHVPVRGIGTVELKIRCQAGSRDSHKIELHNVLHIPSWLCNIMSDIYFTPADDFEHSWTEFGVSFQKREDGTYRPWGFTENFCGLDKIVLSKNPSGRSPMQDDKDREVFSVNVVWPQSQKDKWSRLVAQEMKQEAEEHEVKMKKEAIKKSNKGQKGDESTKSADAIQKSATEVTALKKEARSGLAEISSNISRMKRGPSLRTSSLKAPTTTKSSFREVLPWRKSTEK